MARNATGNGRELRLERKEGAPRPALSFPRASPKMEARTMSFSDRDEPDRDPGAARKTTRLCAIEDGEVKPSLWVRFKGLFRRRRRPRPAESAIDLGLLPPDSLPEPAGEEPSLPDDLV